ncbi:hypothetical protein K1719_005807 [Acacia pycnantha]|nr:hypothetical protein K1719_005807 [Acacia pycnantha]
MDRFGLLERDAQDFDGGFDDMVASPRPTDASDGCYLEMSRRSGRHSHLSRLNLFISHSLYSTRRFRNGYDDVKFRVWSLGILHNSKPDVVHKIKWGDLEDQSFPLPHENLSGAGIKFGTIGDDNMLNCRKSDNVLDAALSDSSCAKDNVPVAKIVDSTWLLIDSFVESKDEISVENGVEVKDTSLEEIPPLNENDISQADDILNSKSEIDVGIKTITDNCIDNDVGE